MGTEKRISQLHIAARATSLPFYNKLTEKWIEYVVENLADIMKLYRRGCRDRRETRAGLDFKRTAKGLVSVLRCARTG